MADPDLKVPHSSFGIFNIFVGVLQLPISTNDKVRKLCIDIDFLLADALCLPNEDGDSYHTPIYSIWGTILTLSCHIPPDHAWQDTLVQLIEALDKRKGDIAPGDEEWEGYTWDDLPELAETVRNMECDKDNFPEDSNYKNFISFIARIQFGFNEGFRHMQHCLEAPLTGTKTRLQLWLVTEWLQRCPEMYYSAFIKPEPGINENTAPGFLGGPLCKDVVPFSVERWEFWKTRLAELKSTEGLFEQADGIPERIDRALAAMEEAEGKVKKSEDATSPVETDREKLSEAKADE